MKTYIFNSHLSDPQKREIVHFCDKVDCSYLLFTFNIREKPMHGNVPFLVTEHCVFLLMPFYSSVVITNPVVLQLSSRVVRLLPNHTLYLGYQGVCKNSSQMSSCFQSAEDACPITLNYIWHIISASGLSTPMEVALRSFGVIV